MSDLCTLYIVRHGQTDWNLNGITQGETDIPLNGEGIKQAETMASNLKHIKFDAVFSSDLIRAKKTAEIIAVEKNLAIETTKLLRERRYGKFNGKPWLLMKKYYDEWENLSKNERAQYKPYKGYETDEEAVGRLITFLRETSVACAGKTILVVAHGGLMRVFLNHLSKETYLTGSVSNLAYIKLESDGVDFFIKELKGIQNPS
ncbi:MAG: histidine phosphatase family protein [Candidatus Daviesbacteria bacterium]|nr:histidine phosphatase family protein [Candidatus Daviesbacteria bacterium]